MKCQGETDLPVLTWFFLVDFLEHAGYVLLQIGASRHLAISEHKGEGRKATKLMPLLTSDL